MKKRRAALDVLPQPTDTTCGPTCLQAVYRYYGDDIPLDRVIADVRPLATGGTLAVYLALHALQRGYRAEIYTYNLRIFDPTWFSGGVDIAAKLRLQTQHKASPRAALATEAYLEFLASGGELRYEELRGRLIRRFVDGGTPILTGLSATYLYGCARELDDRYDDVRGTATGHFVLLRSHDRAKREVEVADPLAHNPGFGAQYYVVGMDRLIGSILLGILTYDSNLLIITPRDETGQGEQ